MKLRQEHRIEVVAAKASISRATAYRIEKTPQLPSQVKKPRGRRRSGPLADIFDAEVIPLLKAAPGIRPVAIFEEMLRRPAKAFAGQWNGGSVPGGPSMATSRKSSFARSMSPADWGFPTSPT